MKNDEEKELKLGLTFLKDGNIQEALNNLNISQEIRKKFLSSFPFNAYTQINGSRKYVFNTFEEDNSDNFYKETEKLDVFVLEMMNSKNLFIDSNNVKLAAQNATEPVLLRNITIELFDQLLTALSNLTSALENDLVYPGGVASPNYEINTVASNVNQVIKQIKTQLDSTKSKITKTI